MVYWKWYITLVSFQVHPYIQLFSSETEVRKNLESFFLLQGKSGKAT